MRELIEKYNTLQRRVFDVIQENRCRGDDIDSFDLLQQAEENFGIELFDFLTELNESEGLSEV